MICWIVPCPSVFKQTLSYRDCMAQMMCNRIWDMNPFKSSNPVSVNRDQKYLVAVWQAVSIRLVAPDRFLLPRSPHNQSSSSICYQLQRGQIIHGCRANCRMLFQVSGCGRGLYSSWHGNGLAANWALESSELPIAHPGDIQFCLLTEGMWNSADVCTAVSVLGSGKQSTSESLLGLRARGVFEMLNGLRFNIDRWWWKKQQDIPGYLWTLGASKHVYLISSQRCVSRIRGDYRDLLWGSVCQILERSIGTWTQ